MVLWSVTENQAFFETALKKSHLRMNHINDWHPRRQLEWLSGRFLVANYLCPDLSKLYVDQQGKLHITDQDIHLSLSHTEGLVGIQIAHGPVGIDVQIDTDKISRVAHKFCNPSEYEILSHHYTRKESERILWSLKECVYKAFGKGKVNYKSEIHLTEFAGDGKQHVQLRLHTKSEEVYSYHGRIRFIGPYCVAQVSEQESK